MCGIAGCYNTPAAPEITRLGLYMQQHRGQEWVGIVSSDGTNIYPERSPFRGQGLVMDALHNGVLRTMMGFMAMGHVRYSTQGASELNNCQPHVAHTSEGPAFFCSNGDIVNCSALRRWLQQQGEVFYSQNDAEVIVKLMAYLHWQYGDWVQAISEAKKRLNGSFSGVLMTRERMFLVRDYLENRPYCYAVTPDGAAFFASESAALDIMTADHPGFEGKDYKLLEVRGDQIIELANGRVTVHDDPAPTDRKARCIFELIYFSRPDSMIFGQSVKEFRRRLANVLVREARPSGDVVSPVPDSSVEAALAISHTLRIPMDYTIYRHHYTGRTFIAPSQTLRDYGVKMKFNPDRRGIRGKKLILVDDSIVRGSTMRKIIGMIKRYQPEQITLLITCPLIMHPCFYGIDMKEKLIAAEVNGDMEAIKRNVGLESQDRLHFTSLAGLRSCVSDPDQRCFACLDGNYPTDVRAYQPPGT